MTPATQITMLNGNGQPAFDIVIYGCAVRDLLTIPNEITPVLARKYRGYFPDMLSISPVRRPK